MEEPRTTYHCTSPRALNLDNNAPPYSLTMYRSISLHPLSILALHGRIYNGSRFSMVQNLFHTFTFSTSKSARVTLDAHTLPRQQTTHIVERLVCTKRAFNEKTERKRSEI
jgi:hypothetical protein